MSLKCNIYVILILCSAYFNFMSSSLQEGKVSNSSIVTYGEPLHSIINDQDVKLMENNDEQVTMPKCSSYVQHTPLHNLNIINQDVLIETLCSILKFITCNEGDVLYKEKDANFIAPHKLQNESLSNNVIETTNMFLVNIKNIIADLLKYEAMFSYPQNRTHYYALNKRKVYERWKTHMEAIFNHSMTHINTSLEINFKEFYTCVDFEIYNLTKNELFSTFNDVEMKIVERKLCHESKTIARDMQIVIEFLESLSLESRTLIRNMHILKIIHKKSENNMVILSEDMIRHISYLILVNFFDGNLHYNRFRYEHLLDDIQQIIQINKELIDEFSSGSLHSLELFMKLNKTMTNVFENIMDDFSNNTVESTGTETINNLFNDLLIENETITYEDIDAFLDLITNNINTEENSSKAEDNFAEDYQNIHLINDSLLIQIEELEHSDIKLNDNVTISVNNSSDEQVTADVHVHHYMADDGNFNDAELAMYLADEAETFVNISDLSDVDKHESKSANLVNKFNNEQDENVNKEEEDEEQRTRIVNATDTMPSSEPYRDKTLLAGKLNKISRGQEHLNALLGDRKNLLLLNDQIDSIDTDKMLQMEDVTYKYEMHEKNNSNTTWPIKQAAEIPGDILLGALMMVHSRSESVTCGPVMAQGGIQALETMLYTLDVINSKEDKKITIGAHILDDCDTDTYGLEMALDFIKGSISNIDDTDYHCNKTQVRKVISGVVGAASSVTSIQVANLLRLFKIPQVSFFSTSPELSNKQRFEYFTRTIPSDHYQVKAMVEIVKKLKWSYVSIIYEESNYGIKAFEELEALLGKSSICIAVKEKLVKDSGVAEERAYDDIVLKLMTKPRARGVIVFGSDQEVAGVMRAVKRLNATGSFSWVGSDGWSARGLVSDGSEAEVEGTLSLQPQANPVRGFDEYFLNLTVENNRRNPWFVEFWEDHFRCKYPNSSRTPYNAHYTKECTTREKLTRESLAFEKQLQFVSDAVMAFSIALNHMHAELCHGKVGLCDAMRPTKGPELLKYLRKVSFQGLSQDHFKFDKDGDGPARYNIIHFKQTSAGVYQWVQVGEYLEGELRLNTSAIQFKISHPSPPESVCSLPCDIGQAKKYVEGESCCWHCFNCSQYQIRMPYDETQCMTCPEGTKPDPLRVRCLEIPAMFIQITSTWAIGAMALSSTGILMTLLIVGVFVRHNNTPVVKAAGRELSYVLLFGILLCYLVTFVLVLKPTDVVCAIQRFGAGFCFTVVYAALLTKTNRISRIFNAGKRTAKRPSFITPKSQLIICGGLVSVQVLINGVWMLVSPPRAIHHYPSREDNILVCSSFINASYMIAFGYPILLIVVCTVYAILTRNIPEAFNESKHIGFTMYTTCVIWLAFVPLYFGTGNHMPLRITTMSVTISLSASVTVACLFSPKLYIILLRPDRNVRTSMMMTYRYSGGTAKTTTSVSMMAAAMAVTGGTNAQISQQLNNAVNQKVLELEMNNIKNNNCTKSPILITRSTQTLDEDPNETSPTSVDPALSNGSNHEASPLHSNNETSCPANPSNAEQPSIPNASDLRVSFHSPLDHEVSSNVPSPPTSSEQDFTLHPHSPSYPSSPVCTHSPSVPTLPSLPSTSNHRSSAPFTLATPSLPSSTANGGTRLTNENTTSL